MIFRKIIFSFILILASGITFAQQPDLQDPDLTKVKVEELSDSQILQVMQRAEESGMSESQVKAALLARGLSPTELNKLEERIANLQSGQSSTEIISRSREDVLEPMYGRSVKKKPVPGNRIFGYNLFRNDNLTFEPSMNIPTPPTYRIGPGDELIIDIWGASQQNYRLPVSPEGSVYIENLGPIQVSGLTVKEASDRLLGQLARIYSGLTGPDRNTYAEVTLGDTRTISVHILGEVNLPGTFTLSSFATMFNALYASGGPTVNGSFRDIELFRNNEKIATLDVYDFLVHGQQDNNIRLQDQDIIKVNPYNTRIELTGEVKRPGIYELSEEEGLGQVIRFSGGFTDKAFKKTLTVYRKTDTERKIVNVSKEQLAGFTLHDGDSIPVTRILDRFENRVTINGAVFRPGEYALNGCTTLREVLNKAEGVREDAFLARALIYRTREDFTLEVIPVDLRAVLSDSSSNVKLKKDDVITVASIFDLREEYFVQLQGEVNDPGTYAFMENITLEDLIVMAGGLKEAATPNRVEVARRFRDTDEEAPQGKISEIFYFEIDKNFEISGEGESFIVEPFDQVFVRRSPGYENAQVMTVTGEVIYPGSYSLSTKGDRISDLIMRAGGLTYDAYPEGARLIRKVQVNEQERRKALESLMKESEDPLVFEVAQETEQAIGIDLEKILEDRGGKHDIFVENGDRLVIPKEMQTVRMTGAVLYPITVRYDKRYGFGKYIDMSGGFASDAKKSKAYVIYANGSIDRTKNRILFNDYPKIEPGAEIIVPSKPPKDKISTQEAIGVSSALTSMALIIVTIINTLAGG
ncbi:MAG: SLBB domain-containing protein [Bacteroidales bacterium]|nr:SLBB domain-containing protein [Bacteroidales bacterium]